MPNHLVISELSSPMTPTNFDQDDDDFKISKEEYHQPFFMMPPSSISLASVLAVKISSGLPIHQCSNNIESYYSPNNEIIYLLDRTNDKLQFFFLEESTQYDNATFEFLREFITINNCGNIKSINWMRSHTTGGIQSKFSCYCLVARDDTLEIIFFSKSDQDETFSPSERNEKILINFLTDDSETIFKFKNERVTWIVKKFTISFSKITNSIKNANFGEEVSMKAILPILEDRHFLILFDNNHVCEVSLQNFLLQICSNFTIQAPKDHTYRELLAYQQFLFCSLSSSPSEMLNKVDIWDISKKKKVGFVNCDIVNLCNFKLSNNGLLLTATCDNDVYIIDLDLKTENVKEEEHVQRTEEDFDEEDDTEGDEEEEEDIEGDEEDEELSFNELLNQSEKKTDTIEPIESLLPFCYTSENFYQSHWFDNTEPQKRSTSVLIDSGDDFGTEKDTKSNYPFVVANKQRKETIMRDSLLIKRGSIGSLDSNLESFSRKDSLISRTSSHNFMLSPRKDENISHIDEGITVIHAVEKNSKIHDYIITNNKCYIIFDLLEADIRLLQVYDMLSGKTTAICLEKGNFISQIYCSDVHCFYITEDAHKHGVFFINVNTNKSILLNNLIKYERQRLAERLCDLNGWDRKSLAVHAIELGLRNRELAVVQDTLQHLDPEQELNVCYIIAKFIQDTKFSKDSEFKIHTITTAISYILSLIEKRILELGSKNEYNLGEEEPNTFDSIFIFKDKRVPIKIESTDSVIKKLEIKNAKKLDKFMESQTISEIDEITSASNDIINNPSSNTISIIEDIMSSKQVLSKPEEVLLLSSIISLLRSYLIYNNQEEEEVNEPIAADLLSSFNSQSKRSETLRSEKRIDLDLSFSGGDNFNDLSFFGSEMKTGVSINNEEDMYNYDAEENEISDADEKNEMEMFDKILMRGNEELYHKWKNMENKSIIVDCLTKGLVSLGYSFLKNRTVKHKSAAECDSEDEDNTNNFFEIEDFESFQQLSFIVIYEHLVSGEYNLAIKMLENLGEDVTEHLRELAFNTIDKNIRNHLIKELKRMKKLSEEEQDVIEFLQLLEELYPDTSIQKVLEKVLPYGQYNPFTDEDFDQVEKNIVIGDISDDAQLTPLHHITSSVVVESPVSSDSSDSLVFKRKVSIQSRMRSASISSTNKKILALSKSKSSYFVSKLSWLLRWDKHTRERILLEKDYHDNESNKSKLAFCIAHHDFVGLVRWSKSAIKYYGNLKKKNESVKCYQTEDGDILYVPEGYSSKMQQVVESCQEVINIVREQLQFCSPMMKELLLNSLAFRGIFIREDTKDFISLLQRFCATYQLFSNDIPSNLIETLSIECDPTNMFDSDKDIVSNPINTTYLHPVGEMSKFHKDFISFCIEKNIPSICFRYIDKFNIWDALDKSFTEDKRPSWLNMFLLSNKKDMFNLSFINAQSKLRNNDNQKINLNSILNENPIMALSTQMYSPKTLHESLEEPITSEHYLNSSYLSKALQPYPTFHSALFNEKSTKHSENPTLSKESQSENETINLCNNEIARGNIVSCQKDISLFDMLKHTHIDMSIDEILMMDEGNEINQGEFNLLTPTQFKINNRDDLFNFSTYESSIKEVLDISYYLMNQRPLEAYKELLSEVNSTKDNELKDLIDDAYSPYLYGGKNEQLPLSNYMDKESQLNLCDRVREIALNNFSNQAITSSCKMFIDLCNFEEYSDKYAKVILVETKVARRIFDFHPSFVAQVDQPQHVDSPSKKLVEEFLQISVSKSTSSVYEHYLSHPQFKILKMLEEATESMLIVDISVKEFLEKEYNSKNSTDPSQVQILDGMRNSGHKIYVSPWKLLSVFSELHGLPPFVNQLKSTAKKGQWISFLYHAQDINAPIETVMSIVEEFMPDVIKQFLIIVLRDMKSKRDHIQTKLSIENNNNDILTDLNQENDIIFKAFLEIMRAEEFNLKNDEVVEYLLNRSLALSEPLLAIVATCYLPKDYTMSELFTCMKCYLQSLKQKLTNTEMKKNETISIKKQNMRKLTESIDRYIQDFCSNNFLKDEKQSGVHYITQSFELFDVNNPIISFLQFYESYVHENIGKATDEMKTFVKVVKDLNSGVAPNFNFGDLTWVVSTSTALAQQLSRSLNTQYKRTNYLQLLHQTQFSLIVDVTNEFENMYSVNSLFERVFKSGEVQEIDHLNVFTGNPNHFIESLIENNCFKEARQVIVMYRKKITYSNDKVTYSQALYKIQKVRSLYVTNTTDIITAYSKVNDLFIKHRYPQESGAKFFLEQAILYQSEYSSTSVLHLLNLALSWYEGTYNITKKRGSIEMTKTNPTPCRNQKDIDYLVQSIVLLSNSADNFFTSGASIVLAPLEARFIENTQNSSKRSNQPNIPTNINNMDELLDKVIDNLLLKEQYKEAKKLANYYSYNSNILQIIEVALTLAKGYELQIKTMYQDSDQRNNSFAAKTLPSNIYSALKDMVLNIDEFDDIQQILDKMSLLSFGYKMKGSKHFLKVIALNHKIGRILQLSYDSVITKDDFEVLKLLLMMFGKEKLKVCSSFIQLRNLDSDRASKVCANYLYSTYVEYYRNEDVSIFKNQEEGGGEILIEDYFQSSSANNNNSGANDSTSSTEDFDDRLSTSSGSSFSSFDFSSSYTASVQTSTFFKQFNQQLKSKPIKTLKESQKQFDLVKCTMDEFAEFANIAKDPSSIARQLIKLIDSDDETNDDSPHKKKSRGILNLKCKVEIIIRAYHCYHMSSSFEGIESILKRIKGPIIQEILDDHDFSLIVRLLVSIPDFSELTFLFDILIENEQFELILKKNKNTDHDNNNQLKMALSSYVQTKFPEQNEKLAMVYLRFNMLKEYGTYLYNRGCKGIKVIHKRLTDKDDSSTSVSSNQSITHLDEHVPLEHVMKIVCENFESAASSLAKEDCCQTAVKSTNLAALVKLQLKFYNELPNKKKLQNLPIIVELGLKEARTFIQNHADFEESLIIANAYDINTMSDWIEPIYNNCVKKGDLEYFNSLRQYLPTSTNLFREVAKRVKLEKPLNPKNLQNFHKFLSILCNDYKVVMDICEDLLQLFSSNSSLVSVANLFAELNKKAISILDYVPIVAVSNADNISSNDDELK
ncbi:hypothetical protein NAEGRDRAFT_78187 [Naegleria gruberi]|uniref:Spatacsin C-terminal domain-containing protein n=1 Tax=Naegleria gruberi TaxID=5762 RepID=D2V1X2_NAEGR|nr:uncharacterized protein NAEGRDRAFT_78187 [Naegleria gruberi]EFC49385.1 hypothetical protein NAEGRDRAFT_78187 [Naegleria gruberi]|eukprot:XP_002682129.1 hypothetical protein NAEGRDRAFT_78187 [Naegleria gruberi strain NEG-M]